MKMNQTAEGCECLDPGRFETICQTPKVLVRLWWNAGEYCLDTAAAA